MHSSMAKCVYIDLITEILSQHECGYEWAPPPQINKIYDRWQLSDKRYWAIPIKHLWLLTPPVVFSTHKLSLSNYDVCACHMPIRTHFFCVLLSMINLTSLVHCVICFTLLIVSSAQLQYSHLVAKEWPLKVKQFL